MQVASWRTTYNGIVPQAYLDAMDVADREIQWSESFAATAEAATYVAVDDGAVCGFVSGGRARTEFPGLAGELYAIYLLREAQDKGIGKRLFSAIADRLRCAGHGGMYVWYSKRIRPAAFTNTWAESASVPRR